MTPNPCHNKPRPAPGARFIVQDGWSSTFYDGAGNPHRTPRYVEIASPFEASRCDYTKLSRDPRCAGCVHENKEGRK